MRIPRFLRSPGPLRAESAEASLLRQPSFWMVQLVGWFLVNALYFREPIESGLRQGVVGLTIALVATSWVAAVAGSSALAAAYLGLPRRWVSGIPSVPVVLVLSPVAALPWALAMTLLVVRRTSVEPGLYGPWMFFHASVLMLAWSGVFFWWRRGERTDAGRTPAEQEARWGRDHRVFLHEGKRVRFCLVRDIAFIRAAGDYAEVHLANGQVATVAQRLRYWESQLPECFIRIHRSTLINLDQSEELVHVDGAWRFRLQGFADPLSVSRRLEQVVMARAARHDDRLPIT